jgi:hypothetical protein
MTLADGTLAVFTIVNSVRFLAYVPQVAKALKDQSGAEAISFATWALFLGSHLSAMAYAIVNQGDWKMASLFLSNAIGCGAILLIAGWKRLHHRKRAAGEGLWHHSLPPPLPSYLLTPSRPGDVCGKSWFGSTTRRFF